MFVGHKLRRSGGLNLAFEAQTAQLDIVNRASSYPFNSSPIGDAHPDRMVVIAVSFVTGNISPVADATCTIDGAAATKIGPSNAFQTTHIFHKKVATGSTADIVITEVSSGSTPLSCAIQVFSFNTAGSGALDSGSVASTSNTNTVSNIECVNNGVVIFAAVRNTTGAGSLGWNGTDSVVETVDAVSEGIRRVFGYVLTTEDSTVRDATSTLGTSGSHVLTVASFEGP